MSKVLAPPNLPPPSEVRRSSPWRYGPTPGPGARPGTAHSRLRPPPPAAPPPGRAPHWGLRLGSRVPGAGESAPTRLGRPLRPQSRRRLSVPAVPSFARAPGPAEKGGGRGVRIWAGLPEVLTQLGPVFSTSRTVF